MFGLERRTTTRIWSTVSQVLSVTLLIGLIVVPLALLGWLIFFTDTFVVQAVTVLDARDHTSQAVRAIIEERVGRNIFFIRTEDLQQRILADVPQVRTAHILRKLPGTLKVVLQEKEPSLLLLSKANYYFVDAEGIAYEEARLDTLPGVVLPVVKNNDQGTNVVIGNPVVEKSFVEFVLRLQEELPNIISAEVAEIRIPSLAAREVHFLLNNNWEIRFDVTRSAAAQLDVLARLLRDTISEEEKQALEYVDLRIPNRVYYRTTNSTVIP